MLVTLEGIVMVVRAMQSEKAMSPIIVTLEGMVTLVRPIQ